MPTMLDPSVVAECKYELSLCLLWAPVVWRDFDGGRKQCVHESEAHIMILLLL